MADIIPSGIDHEARNIMDSLLQLERGRDRWYWRSVGAIVSLSTVTAAVFSALSFFKG